MKFRIFETCEEYISVFVRSKILIFEDECGKGKGNSQDWFLLKLQNIRHALRSFTLTLSFPIQFLGEVRLYPWTRQWHPTPVLLPGKSRGRRSLVGCSPWGREESDTTERLHFHFSLSCVGEGNGSPLQCSCVENPRDGGAWRAAVYGVAQSQTRLKRLSSSSSSRLYPTSQSNRYFSHFAFTVFYKHL